MSIVLQSSGGGSVTVSEPTTASNFTQTLPAGTGTVVVSGINSAITAGTAQASTSGTSIDFTGIPSWVKRITIMLNAVSTSGTSAYQVQIGSGSVTTSGYASSGLNQAGTQAAGSAGFLLMNACNASDAFSGAATLTLQSNNTWVYTSMLYVSGGAKYGNGVSPTLSGTLDRVRITTVNGTDTFDAGSINILYE